MSLLLLFLYFKVAFLRREFEGIMHWLRSGKEFWGRLGWMEPYIFSFSFEKYFFSWEWATQSIRRYGKHNILIYSFLSALLFHGSLTHPLVSSFLKLLFHLYVAVYPFPLILLFYFICSHINFLHILFSFFYQEGKLWWALIDLISSKAFLTS